MAALCVGAVAVGSAIAGCGDGDEESTAKDEPVEVSAANEPVDVFIKRMTRLLATTTDKKDCAQLELINSRSATRFSCPAPADLRKSMSRFKVVDAKEYGSGAVVDYKSGEVKDGATIVLFVAPDRNWGIGRFGIISKPSAKTSDAEAREGYAKAVDEYLAAVRERDCDTFVDITFNGNDKKNVVCKKTFPGTKQLAALLRTNPDAKPRYEGGNASYGFYSLETSKPQPANVTISIAKTTAKGARPFVVLDVTRSPTAAQQKQAQKAFKKSQQQGSNPDMKPSSKPSDPAVTTP